MYNLTRKEVNIIYGILYNLDSFNNYVKGYHRLIEQYEVVEKEDRVIIYYNGTSAWKLPIATAKVRTLCD